MRKLDRKKISRFISIGLCAVVVTMSVLPSAEMDVKAATAVKNAYGTDGQATYQDDYQYQDYTKTEFEKLWKADGQKTAPSKSGYVFGGWCIKGNDNKYTVLTEADLQTISDEQLYAKFVPAYVLSVKAQVDETTYVEGASRTQKGSIRLVSSVDSEDYQKVGFKVLINNKNELKAYNKDTEKYDLPLETKRVYEHLKSGEDTYDANAVFGTKSAFFTVWRLDDIGTSYDAKIINVTPYWITKDGTKVSGLTKYVHMEDGYNRYISIPINLFGEADVAAGTLTLTYPADLQLIGNNKNEVEFGKVFENEMEYRVDTSKNQIYFYGAADVVGDNKSCNGLYANVRFVRKTATSSVDAENGYDFNIQNEKFCNWAGSLVNEGTDIAWDIQY